MSLKQRVALACLAQGLAVVPAFAPGADNCLSSLFVGSIPPDYQESGVSVMPGDEEWRTFWLDFPRRLRVEAVGAAPTTAIVLAEQCDYGCNIPYIPKNVVAEAFGSLETGCLRSHDYFLGLKDTSTSSSFDLRITDLGPCLRENEIVLRSATVVDLDGDQDGFADTGETVELHVTLSNKSSVDLTNVVGVLTTTDPRIACISAQLVRIDSLPAHGTREFLSPFRFRVADSADRALSGATPDSVYAATFALALTGDPYIGHSKKIVVDLDLNAGGPSVPTTTFVEGFENGFGSFHFMNLDFNQASNTASNGLRCNYLDPDFNYCNSYGFDTPCYVGFASGQSPINDWHTHTTGHPDGGRAFMGIKSLHYGVHAFQNPDADTYKLSQLDAIRSDDIPLAAMTCRDAPDARSCSSAADCAPTGGGPCVPARPELSFKHQISLMDSRRIHTPDGEATDRAVVQVLPSPSQSWETLQPYQNVHDVQGTDYYSHPWIRGPCMFDPLDDGNNEDSHFPGQDGRISAAYPFWAWPYGPSSTCMPQRVFACLGDTQEPFAPGNICRASDGPGLQGSVGLGTWVESRFDLSRYRGRSIRIRFVITSLKIEDYFTWRSYLGPARIAEDDGWYVDDLRVTDVLGASSAALALDDAPPPALDADADGVPACADNCVLLANPGQEDLDQDGTGDPCDPDDDNDGALDGTDNCASLANPEQSNSDGDPRGDACDCRPLDPGVWAAPAEARGLVLAGKLSTILSWQPPIDAGGTSVLYDVLRSLTASDFGGAACVVSGIDSTEAQEGDPLPGIGSPYFYLVRAVNDCGSSLGAGSRGASRSGAACP